MAVKPIAIATMVMSVPLMLSFHLKYGQLPAGLVYPLFFWMAVSVYIVPVFLVTEIILSLRIYFSKTVDRSSLRWSVWGISIGLLAEIILIAEAFSPPPRG